MKRVILILVILNLILISGCINNDDDVDKKLAKCIAKKSTLYVSAGCSACYKQKKMFDTNYQYLNMVDCTQEPEKCREVEITSVPTWIIDGKKFKGVQGIEKLKELTKC